MSNSDANRNRKVRRDALIEQLRNKGLCEQVVETCTKLADLTNTLEPIDVQRLTAANNGRLALVKKYLPDAKSIEITGEDGGPIAVAVITGKMDQEQAAQLYKDLISGD